MNKKNYRQKKEVSHLKFVTNSVEEFIFFPLQIAFCTSSWVYLNFFLGVNRRFDEILRSSVNFYCLNLNW